MPAPSVSMFGRLFCAGFALVLCGGVQGWIVGRSHDETPFQSRVQNSGRPVSQGQRCAGCHAGICEAAEASPHRRTLVSADDPQLRSLFAGRKFQPFVEGPVVSFTEKDQQLWMQSDLYPQPLRVDWMFGSGRHAITPVSLLRNPEGATEVVAGSVTWFASGELGPTPGADFTGTPGISSVGTAHDPRTTQECFGCHVSQLPVVQGEIRTDQMVLGVSCDRCHPDAERHAQSMERGGPLLLEKWSELTPLDSINRCGECHRRADQLTPQELQADRAVLVRFAPVGLAMSSCFQKQNEVTDGETKQRLDCLTCHDPHAPADRSSERYLQKCLSCHGPHPSQARVCSSPHTAANCLPCHMPPVLASEKLVLTDHWIRVRKPSDPPVEQTPSHPAAAVP